MEIRRLTPSDYDPFYEVRLASLLECPEEFATDADAWRNAPRETINKLLLNSEERTDMPILGAWKNGHLVGLAGLNRDLRPSVVHKSTLWGVYVLPEHRRQGIGRALLNELISIAHKTPDLRLIRAVVTITSADALSLLEKTGFKRFGQEPEAKRFKDTFYDQVYFWYPLA
jgi:ribosomal protein S18 acetylase RimI-like enzyme